MVQLILKDGKPEWAVIPYEEYERLRSEAEMLDDIRLYDQVRDELEGGEEELIPAGVVAALLAEENPLRVWREFRGLTQEQLAQAAGISSSYLSQIETGRRDGTLEVMVRLARALGVMIDDLAA